MNARRTGGRVAAMDQSVMPSVSGLPWWSVTPLAVALALTGVAIDTSGDGELGTAFAVMFFVGCVGVALAARRSAVFIAGVQPPIIMTVMIPLVYLIAGDSGSHGMFSRTQLVGAVIPLVTRFPLMAATTATAIAVALVRAFVLQPHPRREQPRGDRRPRAAARAAGAGAAARPPAKKAASPGKAPTPKAAPTDKVEVTDQGKTGDAATDAKSSPTGAAAGGSTAVPKGTSADKASKPATTADEDPADSPASKRD